MDRQVELRVKFAVLKERQATIYQYRPKAEERRYAWQLRTEAAQHDQIAYRLFIENGSLITRFDSKVVNENLCYLTNRVEMSASRLINTNQCHNLSVQLSTALNGLSLLGASQPHLFFGSTRLCATYGRILDELKELDKNAARRCLDRFDNQSLVMTRNKYQKTSLIEWIGSERERVKGKSPQLIGLYR